MKVLAIVLFIVCLLETYLVLDARKERNHYRDSLAMTRDNYINTNILAIKVNIKLAEKMVTEPAEALDLVNKIICSGNPFPDNFLNIGSVAEETKVNMRSLKDEVTTHCKL